MLKPKSHKGTLLFLAVLALLLGFEVTAQAQFGIAPIEPERVGNTITCYVGGLSYELKPDKLLIIAKQFAPTNVETQKVFDAVTRYTDLRSNIYTVPVTNDINVQICPSDGGTNYIAYSPRWLQKIYDETNNEWVLYAIIAHETGHYALGHDKRAIESNPEIEKAADEYAGEILAKMGASLTNAQAAFESETMRKLKGKTHPPIKERLAAVKKGWEKVVLISSMPQVDLSPIELPQAAPFQVDLKIDIMGQLNTIYILPASSSAPASAGQVKMFYQLETKTFYLEYGKAAEVTLYGQANKVYISPKISNRVKVTQHGQNNEIIIR